MTLLHENKSRRLRAPAALPLATAAVGKRAATAPSPANSPARITRCQLGLVLAVLRRVAAGGDATCGVDAAALVPVVDRCMAVAPVGQKPGRQWFSITWPSGKVERQLGAKAVSERIGRSRSHTQNVVSVGGGRGEFACVDEHGNPAVIVVERLAQ